MHEYIIGAQRLQIIVDSYLLRVLGTTSPQGLLSRDSFLSLGRFSVRLAAIHALLIIQQEQPSCNIFHTLLLHPD